MANPLRGRDLDDYIQTHRTGGQAAHGPSIRTTDSVERAKVEQEALMTLVLAVLICWLPFATVFTLVAGAGRWMTAHRGWGGAAGAPAVVFSAAVLAAWVVILFVV